MSYQLISAAAISALVAGTTFPSVLPARRQQLAAQVAAAANELDQTIPFLLANAASTDEANFIRALVGGSAGGAVGATIPAPVGGNFAATITSVGDGAATSLEALPTLALIPPVLRTIILASTGEEQDWELVAGTDANDAMHQQPLDFDAVGNSKVWLRKR